MITEFFKELEDRGVAYVVMGDTTLLPERQANDIDIVLSRHDFCNIGAIVRDFAEKTGAICVQHLPHREGQYYVLRKPGNLPDSNYLILDFCADFVRHGRRHLDASWLLEHRIRAGDAPGRSFYVAAHEREFAYYIQKKIDKGSVSPDALKHLASTFHKNPDGCRTILKRYWAHDSARLIETSILTNDAAAIHCYESRLRRELRRKFPPFRLRHRLEEVKRLARRMLRPTGLVIGILGPDGSGKSTLLPLLRERIEPAFRRANTFHLSPPLLRVRKVRTVVEDPHAQSPRGALMSVAKLLYFVARYQLGWMRSVWLQKRASGLFIFDRYYHDMLADPQRYRNGAPEWVVRLIGRLIPRPDIWLVLDVAPDIVRARKLEVSPKENFRQFHAYRALARELKEAHLIDASGAPEDVAAACERAILAFMATRLADRAAP